jgi:hypothetical protein
MTISKAFAILAPVAEPHLISGRETCDREGKVAFGSDAWELFREADEIRKGQPVEILIYPSHPESDKPLLMSIAWHGIYLGHLPSRRGRYPGEKRFRPDSASLDKSTWAVFWEVENLSELPISEQTPIAAFHPLNKKASSDRRLLPHGPLLVEYP